MKRWIIIATLGAIVVVLIAFGPQIWFGIFHSDIVTVDHLLILGAGEHVARVEVTDAVKNPLWVIESDGSSPVTSVDYGVVPTGFHQLYPEHANPRALQDREVVRLTFSAFGQRWCYVPTRSKGSGRYQQGIVLSGKGCPTPLCDEKFAFRGWSAER